MSTTAIHRSTAGNWKGGKQRDRLITEAHTVLANCGVAMGPAKVRRLVQTYERNGRGLDLGRFIASQVALTERSVVADELRRVTTYTDRTGELATDNVLRDQRGTR